MNKPELPVMVNPGFYGVREMNDHGEACYEAGKRDALPVWPPPNVTFKWKSCNQFPVTNVKYCTENHLTYSMWRSDSNYAFDKKDQAKITAAYFMEELEEVTE